MARLEAALRAQKEQQGEASRRTADNLVELGEISQRDTFRNLVTNGDFSAPYTTGAPSGWTITAAGPPTLGQSTSVPGDCSGNALTILCAAANAGVYQDITVKGGVAYTVCFRFKSGGNNVAGRVNITTNGTDPINNDNDLVPVTNPAQWERTGETIDQVSYETPSDATSMRISLLTASATPVVINFAEISLWEGVQIRQYTRQVLDERTELPNALSLSGFMKKTAQPEGLAGNDLAGVYPNPDVQWERGILANEVFG